MGENMNVKNLKEIFANTKNCDKPVYVCLFKDDADCDITKDILVYDKDDFFLICV